MLNITSHQRDANIKTMMRYHLTPVRIAIINKSKTIVLVRMWRKGNPHALLVRLKIGATTVENNLEFLKILKIELPFDQQSHIWVFI